MPLVVAALTIWVVVTGGPAEASFAIGALIAALSIALLWLTVASYVSAGRAIAAQRCLTPRHGSLTRGLLMLGRVALVALLVSLAVGSESVRIDLLLAGVTAGLVVSTTWMLAMTIRTQPTTSVNSSE